MENIIAIILLVSIVILFKYIFRVNYKRAKALEENKEMQIITDKFPENIDIAEEMLKMLDNKNVKIEQAKDTKTSLYIAVTNKILIADLKNNYGRIQTIAHECIHSIQDKRLLMFNFIFSNITILYFIIISILTLCNTIKNTMLQICILLALALVQFAVRSFLEIDAMTKSKYLAKEYMEKKELCSKQEIKVLVTEYDKINKIGVPFIIDNLLSNELVKLIIYVLICIISKI